MELKQNEYLLLRDLVFKNFGINLTEAKKALIIGRLQSLLSKYSLNNFEDYHKMLINDKSGTYLSELVNKISTNYTFFYREEDHFNFFSKIALPQFTSLLKSQRSNDLRLWCAGCASGEEPYTLMMVMRETMGNDHKNWNAGILATDISQNALDFAMNGIYPNERLNNLPSSLKNKYFNKHEENSYEISSVLKKDVTYRRFNLMNENWPFKNKFHMIFCRNVMIYFDENTRDVLVNKFAKYLVQGGYLFIGHSESIDKKNASLTYLAPALYKKK